MSSEEKKIVDFVLHLPADSNPYGAVAQHLKGLLTPPRLDTWATTAQRCAIGMFIIMFVQSVHLIYARVKVGAYKFWSFSQLGLYNVDVASACGTTYTIYCFFAIADLFLLDLANSGRRDLSGEIPLFGCKYIVIVGNAWFFLWVCACQCATLVCESGLGETSGPQRTLHPAIRIVMNASLLVAHLVPIPFVIYHYTRVNQEYDMAKSILHGVLHNLHTKAATVTPQNYNRMALLAMLAPARSIQPHAHQMASHTRNGITVYLAELIIISVLYVPLLTFSLGRLYARSVSQKKLTQVASSGEAGDHISKMGRKIREQRRRLVTHAIMTYVTTSMHVPIIIAQLSYEGDGFLRDKTWMTLTRVGLSLPFSITGNAIAFVLNLHARNQLIDSRSRTHASSAMSSSFSTSHNKETFMPKYNPAFGEKEMELSILPRFPGLNSDTRVETIDTRQASSRTYARSSDSARVPLHNTNSSLKPDSQPIMKKLSVQFNTGA